MKSKRGQFYIITAAVIISVILGIALVENYARLEREKTKVYDLGEELDIETGHVYDYGMYSGEGDLEDIILNWSLEYSQYLEEGGIENWTFVYEDEEGTIKAINFTKQLTGILEGGISGRREISDVLASDIYEINVGEEDDFEITFENYTYEFTQEEGQNFYFVIGEEGYIVSSGGGQGESGEGGQNA